MHQKWTETQRQQALSIAERSTCREASEKTGIPEGSIKRWRKELREGSHQGSEPSCTEPNETNVETRVAKAELVTDEYSNLTPKQRAFVEEYLVDLNATQAAIRAGYSRDTARVQGPRQLSKVAVQKALQHAMAQRSRRTEIKADRVLQQLARIAFADVKDFVTWDGNRIQIRPSDEVDGTVLAEISETINENGRNIKIKPKDGMRALEMIGRHLGMFSDRVQLDGQMNIDVVHSEMKRRFLERFEGGADDEDETNDTD